MIQNLFRDRKIPTIPYIFHDDGERNENRMASRVCLFVLSLSLASDSSTLSADATIFGRYFLVDMEILRISLMSLYAI